MADDSGTADEDSTDVDDAEGPEERGARGERQGIQSVENAMAILAALEAGGGPMTLGEVAARAGSRPNKVHRYLVSLVRVGLASQSPTSGRYDLGPAMRRLGAEALRRTNEVSVAAEHTPLLRDATGHSVNISVWGDDGPVVVRWDYGAHALPLSVRVGATLPLLTSSAGQVFFTHLPRQMTTAALAATRRAVRQAVPADELDAVRQRVLTTGVAVTTNGVIPGVSSLSAPVFTASDSLPLAVSVVLPGEDLDAAEHQRVRGLLLDCVGRISAELGARHPADP